MARQIDMLSNKSTSYFTAALLLSLGYEAINNINFSFAPPVQYFFTFLLIFFTSVFLLAVILGKQLLQWIALGTSVLLLVSILVSVGINARAQQPFAVHDGILQIEAALNYLEKGINPYSADYTAAFGPQIRIIVMGVSVPNPAASHFISLPLHLLIGLPFQWFFSGIFHWFDFRVVHWTVGVAFALYVATRRSIDRLKRQLWLVLFFLNPLFLPFFVEGRNDVVVLAGIGVSVLLLLDKKYRAAAVVFALANVTKESAWFMVPFFAAFYFAKYKAGEISKTILIQSVRLFVVICAVVFIPFFVWSPRDFVDDLLLYPSGGSATSYPINGFSIAGVLYSAGLVHHVTDPVPLWSLLIIVVFPILYYLVRLQLRAPNASSLVSNYAIFILFFWVCSRFFHDNYLGYITQLLLFAWLVHDETADTDTLPQAAS